MRIEEIINQNHQNKFSTHTYNLFKGNLYERVNAVRYLHEISCNPQNYGYNILGVMSIVTDVFDDYFYQKYQQALKENNAFSDTFIENRVKDFVLMLENCDEENRPVINIKIIREYCIRQLNNIKRRIVCQNPNLIEDYNLLDYIAKIELKRVDEMYKK